MTVAPKKTTRTRAQTARKTGTKSAGKKVAATVQAETKSLTGEISQKAAPILASAHRKIDRTTTVVKSHPRLVSGVVLGAGLVIGALVLRRFAPKQARQLGAAAASMAIAAGGPVLLDALMGAPKRIAKSKITRRAVSELKKTPDRIADLHLGERARDVSDILVKRTKTARGKVRHMLAH